MQNDFVSGFRLKKCGHNFNQKFSCRLAYGVYVSIFMCVYHKCVASITGNTYT